jgi:hypothetical protein
VIFLYIYTNESLICKLGILRLIITNHEITNITIKQKKIKNNHKGARITTYHSIINLHGISSPTKRNKGHRLMYCIKNKTWSFEDGRLLTIITSFDSLGT